MKFDNSLSGASAESATKVLIVSVTAGRGHHEAAKNCAEELASRGCVCVTADLLDRAGRFYYHAVDKGYNMSIKHFKGIYGKIFRRAGKRKASKWRTPTSLLLRGVTVRAMRELLAENRPDAVLCTHVIGAMAMDELKRRGEAVPPTYGLVTDYDIHPFWEDVPRIERMFVAHPKLIEETRKRGIADAQVTATGIPVAAKFNKARPQIAKKPFVVLLMGGSMGFGGMERTAFELAGCDGVYVICVCAKNRRAYDNISAAGHKNVEVYGEVSNVDELMDRAHIIVTKPGGLSTTEAATKGLPMVLTAPIPGQEEANARFLEAQGAAVLSGDFVAAHVAELITDAGLYAKMAAAAEGVVRFSGDGVAAACRIADLIQGGAG